MAYTVMVQKGQPPVAMAGNRSRNLLNHTPTTEKSARRKGRPYQAASAPRHFQNNPGSCSRLSNSCCLEFLAVGPRVARGISVESLDFVPLSTHSPGPVLPREDGALS